MIVDSGAGFERFCVAGESDISNASRPIKDGKVEECGAIDRNPIEFRVGTDALAVTVSAGNHFAADITLEELAVLFAGADTWKDVRADWPATRLLCSRLALTRVRSTISLRRSSTETRSRC